MEELNLLQLVARRDARRPQGYADNIREPLNNRLQVGLKVNYKGFRWG